MLSPLEGLASSNVMISDMHVKQTARGEGKGEGEGEGKPWAPPGGQLVLVPWNHFAIIPRSLAAQQKVCSLDWSRNLPLTSLFPQLDMICLNAGIPPAKVHAVCSDVGHILIIM